MTTSLLSQSHCVSGGELPTKNSTIVAMATHSAVHSGGYFYTTGHTGCLAFTHECLPPPSTMLASLFVVTYYILVCFIKGILF